MHIMLIYWAKTQALPTKRKERSIICKSADLCRPVVPEVCPADFNESTTSSQGSVDIFL